MPQAPAFPQARFIETTVGPAIVAQAMQSLTIEPLPRVATPYVFLHTVVFDEEQPDLIPLIEHVAAALTATGMTPDFATTPDLCSLTIEPEPVRGNFYCGLKIIQKLFKPQIPHTAIVYEEKTADRWDIQLSVLGGHLPDDLIAAITEGVTLGGGKVQEIAQLKNRETEVFFVSVPNHGAVSRQAFLHGLRESCGVFATLQTHPDDRP